MKGKRNLKLGHKWMCVYVFVCMCFNDWCGAIHWWMWLFKRIRRYFVFAWDEWNRHFRVTSSEPSEATRSTIASLALTLLHVHKHVRSLVRSFVDLCFDFFCELFLFACCLSTTEHQPKTNLYLTSHQLIMRRRWLWMRRLLTCWMCWRWWSQCRIL